MEAGAFGLSTGLVYPPSAYSTTEELIALARSMARRDGLYFSHIRGEAAMLEASIVEAIRIGVEGKVGVQIAHVKAAGRGNWAQIDPGAPPIVEGRGTGGDGRGGATPPHSG